MIAEAHGGPPRLYNRSKRLGGDDRIKNYTELTLEQRQVVENFSSPMTDNNAERFLSQFSTYMATLELPQSELAQIRDDMLEIADVTLYLFTLE